jgi:hypothetical protein
MAGLQSFQVPATVPAQTKQIGMLWVSYFVFQFQIPSSLIMIVLSFQRLIAVPVVPPHVSNPVPA